MNRDLKKIKNESKMEFARTCKFIKKDLGSLRKICFNNFSIEAYLLNDDRVLVSLSKLTHHVPHNFMILESEQEYRDVFEDESLGDVELLKKGFEELEPWWESPLGE